MNVTDLSDLTDDGDTYELPDGRTLRLRFEPDDINPFDDNPDFYGLIAWTERHRDYVGDAQRPEGFNGAARKLWAGGDRFWWQPPKDVIEQGPDAVESMASQVKELAEYGYCCLILEVLYGEDAYHRPIVVAATSLGGIEPFPDNDYVREVVQEQLAELGLEVPA